ncbi:MAG: ComF family protein [Chloroflexi bacterium]|jgi:competence protein ComFC|nr:ComF family protein [Chloroflexota bacterium]
MPVQTRLAQIPDFILDLLFPKQCIGCGSEGEFLCTTCAQTLPNLVPPFCNRCGLPTTGRSICPDCHNLPLAIDGIRSLYNHEGLARDLVHAIKYKNMKAMATPMASLMAAYLESNPLPIDILAPIPMHAKRLRKRGYNQAGLLAKELSNICNFPSENNSIIKVKNTVSQVTLPAEDRHRNVEGVVLCKDRIFIDKEILLIDDVCTTGATLNACALALKNAGAITVWGLTFSREC